MNKGERGNTRGAVNRPINQPRIPQAKTAQPKTFQPVPHINQHSVHMQRVAQAKMAQTRPALKPPVLQRTAQLPKAMQLKVPNRPAASGVVQRSECLTGVIESVKACWDNLPSFCSTPRREQYEEISDISSSESSSSDTFGTGITIAPTQFPIRQVGEEATVNNIGYPASVNGGYISSCALVIFCFDDSFDCYHAKGGNYKTNHRLRSNPKRIFYVYKTESNDTERTIENYRWNAGRFQYFAGGKPKLEFYGQDLNGNVWVDVHSPDKISPKMGTFK